MPQGDADGPDPARFSHRRTRGEVRRIKKADRSDLRPSEWSKYGYAKSDILTRPIEYDAQTQPIPRVKYSEVTAEGFYEKFTSRNQPVIVEGAAAHWPAMRRWSMERLAERFKHVDFKVGEDSKGKKLRTKFKYFADYMRHQQDDNPLYLFEADFYDKSVMKPLLDDFEVPDLFPDDYQNMMNHDSRPPHRWFCIGPKRSGTTVHVDPLGTSAWNVVTHGVKRWVLFEPGVPKRVAKGRGLKRKEEDDEAVMYFDFLLPRLKKANPDVRVYEGLQNPGDLIFVPGGWWHGVLNTEDCVAVTQNYCGPDNFDVVWSATRSGREKIAHLWLRNMRKFAPKLHKRALQLNREAGFKMRNERPAAEKLPDASSSSSESSDSTSDEARDFSPTGLENVVDSGVLSGVGHGQRRRRSASPSQSEPRKRPRAEGRGGRSPEAARHGDSA